LLEKFPGGFLAISHDRHFIGTHGDKLYTFENGSVRLLLEETTVDLVKFQQTMEIITQQSEDDEQ